LVCFADLDLIHSWAQEYDAPKVGISWAYDLQQSFRNGAIVESQLQNALEIVDLLIVDSKAVARIAKGYGFPMSRIVELPYGIDLETIQTYSKNEIPRIKNQIYTNRRWDYHYRNDLILEACLKLREQGQDFHLVLSNDGPERKRLCDEYVTLFESAHCSYLGEVDQVTNVRLLKQSNLYLSASINDGTSVSMLEAFATETPVLLARNEANEQWVAHQETGFLFDAATPSSLSSAIADAMNDEGRLSFVAIAAKKNVENKANWIRNQQKVREVINQLMAIH
jgi:glycosyltransferase involved in cell wall biosynthesis